MPARRTIAKKSLSVPAAVDGVTSCRLTRCRSRLVEAAQPRLQRDVAFISRECQCARADWRVVHSAPGDHIVKSRIMLTLRRRALGQARVIDRNAMTHRIANSGLRQSMACVFACYQYGSKDVRSEH